MKNNECVVFTEVDGVRQNYEMHSFLSSFHYFLAKIYNTSSSYSGVYGSASVQGTKVFVSFEYEPEKYFWQQGTKKVNRLFTHGVSDFGYNATTPHFVMSTIRDTDSDTLTVTMYSEYTNISGSEKTIRSIQLANISGCDILCSDVVNVAVPAGSKVRLGYSFAFSSRWTRNIDSFLENELNKQTLGYVKTDSSVAPHKSFYPAYHSGGELVYGSLSAGIVLGSDLCTFDSNEFFVNGEITSLSGMGNTLSIEKGDGYSQTVIKRVFLNTTESPVTIKSAGFCSYYGNSGDRDLIMLFRENFNEPVVVQPNEAVEIALMIRVP